MTRLSPVSLGKRINPVSGVYLINARCWIQMNVIMQYGSVTEIESELTNSPIIKFHYL
jgi:hypothetical protein